MNSILDEPCRNDAGYRCLKPYEYDGENFWKCTTAGDYSYPWCYDERGDGKWDKCFKCAKEQGINFPSYRFVKIQSPILPFDTFIYY